mgnify:CR=1 FL=1
MSDAGSVQLIVTSSLFSDLSKAVQDSVTSSGSDGESDPALDTEKGKPSAGYRRTTSFDRFPFMSRPLRSAGRRCLRRPPTALWGAQSSRLRSYDVDAVNAELAPKRAAHAELVERGEFWEMDAAALDT